MFTSDRKSSHEAIIASTSGTEREEYPLNSQRIAQMLGDRLFYLECVAYFFLEDMGLEAYSKYTGIATGGKPSTMLMNMAVVKFVRFTLKLHDRYPPLLDPLANYLCSKLGYRPGQFAVYYADRGTPRKLVFIPPEQGGSDEHTRNLSDKARAGEGVSQKQRRCFPPENRGP